MTRIVAEILAARAAESPDAAFVKCGGDWVTNEQLNRRAAEVSGGLRELGLGKGDRIAFILPNRQEMLELFFACAQLGAIQVPLNTFLKGEFLAYPLIDSGAKVAVVDAAGYRSLLTVIDQTAVETVVLVDPDEGGAASPVRTIPYQQLETAATGAESAELRAGDLLSILYTSGTTGPSKGCMLSNGYYTASPPEFEVNGWISAGDRVFTALPLFHGAANAILMHALMVPGGSVCFEPTFSATAFMARAAEEESTVLWMFPPIAQAILNQGEKDAEAAMKFRLAIVPGMPVHAQAEFERRFGAPVAGDIYGQTECLGIAFSSLSGPRKPGTMGVPAPHLEVRLVDDDDTEVAVGEIGEVVVRSRKTFAMYSGYWGKPEATVEAWRNLWHHTGDLAKADADGYLTFVDRKKDSLRRRGENISSFELETAISKHPKVARAAACGLPSALGDDDIKVCIVPVAGETPSAAELFEYFMANLPYFAVPRYVEVRADLPVTAATDRVQKHVLRGEGVTPGTWDLEEMGLTVPKEQRR